MTESGVDSGWSYSSIDFKDVPEKYMGITGWVHYDSGSGETRDFPLSDDSAQAEADTLPAVTANQNH